MKIQTALLSVSDKTGIVEFATALSRRGVRLLSTGGTARMLAQAGLEVTDVASRYRERADLSRIPARSTWTRAQSPGVPEADPALG